MTDALRSFTAFDRQASITCFMTVHTTDFAFISLFIKAPYKAGAVFAEGGFHICGLNKGVYEAHLAVEQRTGLHEVIYHLLSADLSIPDEWRETEHDTRE